MKSKSIRLCGTLASLVLLAACAANQPATVASARQSRPPAQNVHTSTGGSVILDLQQRGGQGNMEGAQNAIGGFGH
jgi:uncharacterized lipoprotein YajG